MKFKELAQYFQKIEDTQSRNEITALFAEILKKSPEKEIDKICYLSLGRLTPRFDPLEFNLAEKMVQRAIAKAYEVDAVKVEKLYKQEGDLGEVVSTLSAKRKVQSAKRGLSVGDVYHMLLEIASVGGEGSQDKKVRLLADLLSQLDSASAKYVVRIPLQKLRLGFSDVTILDSLSHMLAGDKSLRKELEHAYNVSADIGRIATLAKKGGIKGIKKVKASVGTPIRTAQAERLPTPADIVEKLEEFAVEAKYDGIRVQIHIDKLKTQSSKSKIRSGQLVFLDEKLKKGPYVRIFSRNLEDMTHMFPDIVRAAQKLPVKQAIFDCEAIAYNPKSNEFLSFQETVQRRRKYGVGQKTKEIPLRVFVFDLLYHDKKELLNTPFSGRRKILEKIFKKNRQKGIRLTDQRIATTVKETVSLFDLYVSKGLEGIMCKKLDSVYQAGARNFNWIKYKRIESKSLQDTIDCVVMGYYVGKGRRSSFGIGAFLVGIQDQRFEYLTVAKVGTGVTDEQWGTLKKKFDDFESKSRPDVYRVEKNLKCDVWVKPKIVVEIRADEITQSPMHSARFALRFPRLIRVREDKTVDDITTLKEVEKLYGIQPASQKVRGQRSKGKGTG